MSLNLPVYLTFLSMITFLLVGCNLAQPPGAANLKTARLRIDGFKKTKSGIVWMSWPETVKQALEELAAVKKIEMVLENDEFWVTYDPTKACDEILIETVGRTGFNARAVYKPD